MPRSFKLTLVSVLILSAACGRHGPREGDQVVSPRRVSNSEPVADNPNRVFGDDGELLESNLRIASLTLPRGLTPRFTAGRQHTFETTLPAEQVQRYFGPRLITGNVERIGDGAIYRSASVRGAPASAARVDVAILPLSTHRYSVSITELAVVPEHLPTEDAIRAALHNQQEEAR